MDSSRMSAREHGKYWLRRLIGAADTPLTTGDQSEERTAFVLLRYSKEKALDEFSKWEKEVRSRFR
jgi:hypothetical protein